MPSESEQPCRYVRAVEGTRIRLTGSFWVRNFPPNSIGTVVLNDNAHQRYEGIHFSVLNALSQREVRRIPPWAYDFAAYDFKIVRD